MHHGLIEDDKQVGLFELDFQTGIASIFDMNGTLIAEQKLSNDQFARFLTIDPHAEKYYSTSPYVYANNNPMRFIDPDGRDWIENSKTGDVEWRKDINKDNVPKGYSYIGTEYKGISIYFYDDNSYKTKDAHYSHVEIKIGYKDPNTGKQSKYNWIQTVERDDEPRFIDPKKDNGNKPYYQSKHDNMKHRNDQGYDVTFYDRPDEYQSNGYFDAELSLVGDPIAIQKGNSSYAPNSGVEGQNIYEPIITLNYGFSIKNGVFEPTPVKVVSPSPYQMKTIRSIP